MVRLCTPLAWKTSFMYRSLLVSHKPCTCLQGIPKLYFGVFFYNGVDEQLHLKPLQGVVIASERFGLKNIAGMLFILAIKHLYCVSLDTHSDWCTGYILKQRQNRGVGVKKVSSPTRHPVVKALLTLPEVVSRTRCTFVCILPGRGRLLPARSHPENLGIHVYIYCTHVWF